MSQPAEREDVRRLAKLLRRIDVDDAAELLHDFMQRCAADAAAHVTQSLTTRAVHGRLPARLFTVGN